MTQRNIPHALGFLLLFAGITANAWAVSFVSPTDIIPNPSTDYTKVVSSDGGVVVLEVDVNALVRMVAFKISGFDGGPPLPVGPFTSTQSPFNTLLELSLDGPGGTIDAMAVDTAMMTVESTPTPGLYNAEISDLDITNGGLPAGWIIRESPTLASTGQTSVETLPGGLFRIDSFFDVFVELSIDAGQNWIPASGPFRIESTPEPGSFVMASLAGFALIGVAQRHRNRLQLR